MKARYHAIVSIVLALPFIYTGRFYTGLVCFLFGVFMDVDHELDFFIEYGRFTLSARDLSEQMMNRRFSVLPFHSIEFILLLCLLSYTYPWLIGAVIGVSVHLVFDKVFNGIRLRGLFFIYRAVNGFRREAIY